MADVRTRSYRARTKYAYDIIARRLKRLRVIEHRNPTEEWAYEWLVLEQLEISVFSYLEAQGIDGDLWPYYVGYAKEVWERMLKFTDLTLALEIQSLQNEYVLRGLVLAHLQALIEIAQYYYNWKNSDEETEPMYVSRFRVDRSAMPWQTIPSGGFHVIEFNTVEFDILGEYDPATFRFTPKEEGYYILMASAFYSSAVAGSNWQVGFYLNGPTVLTNDRQSAPGGGWNAYAHTMTLEKLLATDYVQVKVNQNSGAPITLGNNRYGTYFCMQRVG